MNYVATFRYKSRPMPETIEDLVQARLDAKGWTLGQLAERSDISSSGLRKILRGQVTDARGPTVARIAKALGVAPSRVRKAIENSRKE